MSVLQGASAPGETDVMTPEDTNRLVSKAAAAQLRSQLMSDLGEGSKNVCH